MLLQQALALREVDDGLWAADDDDVHWGRLVPHRAERSMA
jgi:hypothetical protein